MERSEPNRIKQARTEAGLTQREMSDALGIPLRTIQGWEEGTRTPASWIEKLVVKALKTMKPKG